MATRVFTLSAGGLTLAAQPVTLAFINPAAAPNFGIEIMQVDVSQSGSVTSTQYRIQLVTQVTAFPTLTSATPQKNELADPNASIITGGTAGAAGTSGVNASAEGAGAKTVRYETDFNNLNGFLWCPPEAGRIKLPAGLASGFGVFLPASTGAANTGWAVSVMFREY